MKKIWKASLMIIVATAILAMGACGLLYCYNNKYTTKENKAINGILCVNEDEKQLYFLSGEWEYYPELLLTPQMLEERKDYYFRYLSIGEYGGMDLGNRKKSPWGSGTYRMILALPEKEKSYALNLGEIFSAYSLYVNGELIGQVGNPDPQNYREEIQNRTFIFKAGGTTELMISVTDQSSPFSGIQSVPVFGRELQVNLHRGRNILIHVMNLSFSAFILLFSIFLFWKNRDMKMGLFCLICFCVLGYTVYPIIHIYFPLKVQPWYAIELFSYFMMFVFVILLQDSLLDYQGKSGIIISLILTFLTIGLLVTEMFSVRMKKAGILYAASGITELMKWGTAAFLIGRSLWSANKKYCGILLTGSVAYGCSLAADRIWRAYEPVIGGWFPELGGGVLILCLGIVQWRDLSDAYRFRMVYEEHSRQMEERLMMQKQHYEELSGKMDEIRRIHHDIRHHMRMLTSLLEKGKYEEMKVYLQDYAVSVHDYETICYCRNMTVDAIIHYYASVLKKNRIEFVCEAEVPKKTEIKEQDFCKLFGNLLENAVQAVCAQPSDSHKFVHLYVKVRNRKLLIEIENSFSGQIQKKNNLFYSVRHGRNGIGTASVMETAQKYGGYADFQVDKQCFRASVFLSLGHGAQKSESEEKRYSR